MILKCITNRDSTPNSDDCRPTGMGDNRCSNRSINSDLSARIGIRGCISAATAGQTLILDSEDIRAITSYYLTTKGCANSIRCCGLPTDPQVKIEAPTCIEVYNAYSGS